MFRGYMASVLWIPWILRIPWILSILAFTGDFLKLYFLPVSRDKTNHQRPRGQKGLRECKNINLFPITGERQNLMTASKISAGHNSEHAREHTSTHQYSGNIIDILQNVNKKGMHIMETFNQFGISKEGRITIKGENGDIEVRLFNFERVNLNVHSRKLLDMLLMKLSEQLPYGEEATRRAIVDKFDVTITLKEFMKLCALSDRKNAREQLRAAAECLISIYMTFDYKVWEGTGKRRKSVKKHFSSYLLDSTEETRTLDKDPVIDSRICVAFSVKLLEYLCTRYIMPVNIKIFTINPQKNPHAYTIARHLSEVYRVRMNKGQPPRIAVKTLLEKACPELPTVDEINDRHYEERHYARNIMLPFERDLDAIADIYGLVDWHYTHENGAPLTDEELGLNGEKGYSFEDWLTFMIDFTLPDYPDTTDRVRKYQAAKRRRAAAQKE